MFDSLPTIPENFADYSRVYETTRHNGYTTGLYSNPRPTKYFIAKSQVPYVVSVLRLKRNRVKTSAYGIASAYGCGINLRLSRWHTSTLTIETELRKPYNRMRPSRVREGSHLFTVMNCPV